jgi:hypothetical protein
MKKEEEGREEKRRKEKNSEEKGREGNKNFMHNCAKNCNLLRNPWNCASIKCNWTNNLYIDVYHHHHHHHLPLSIRLNLFTCSCQIFTCS